MAGQHELTLVPVNSPVGPTGCSKYINVLYAPFHPRNFRGPSFAFFFWEAGGWQCFNGSFRAS